MASYEKALLIIVGLCLAWHNLRAGYSVQALSLVMAMRSVLKESSSECVLLLMPFMFLGERCLEMKLALGHSPLPFYASALFSYVASFPSSSTWPIFHWALCGIGSGGLLVLLTGKPRDAIGLIAQFVAGGSVLLLSNSQRNIQGGSKVPSAQPLCVPRREALLVASVAASLVLDTFINSYVGGDVAAPHDEQRGGSSSLASQLQLSQLTSFTHIAGRSSLVCAVLVALCMSLKLRMASSSSSGRQSFVFAIITLTIVGIAYVSIARIMEEDPCMWLWAYVHSRKLRLYAVLLWCTGIPLAVIGFNIFFGSMPQAMFRKLYHALALVAFLPIAVMDPLFMGFAIVVATSLVILLECARCCGVYGARWVNKFVAHQIDERDGGIVRTHIYLIIGLGLSMFFRHRSELMLSRPTPYPLVLACDLLPGLISLGVLDAVAAVVGTRASLRHRRAVASSPGKKSGASSVQPPTTLASVFCGAWFDQAHNPAMGRRTFIGCFWGFVAGSSVWIALLLILFGPMILLSRWLVVGIAALGMATLWEGACNGIDNLELPLFVYACVTTIGAFALQ